MADTFDVRVVIIIASEIIIAAGRWRFLLYFIFVFVENVELIRLEFRLQVTQKFIQQLNDSFKLKNWQTFSLSFWIFVDEIFLFFRPSTKWGKRSENHGWSCSTFVLSSDWLNSWAFDRCENGIGQNSSKPMSKMISSCVRIEWLKRQTDEQRNEWKSDETEEKFSILFFVLFDAFRFVLCWIDIEWIYGFIDWLLFVNLSLHFVLSTRFVFYVWLKKIDRPYMRTQVHKEMEANREKKSHWTKIKPI